jgi:DNA-directed RNA polymerase subunit D
MSLRIDHMSERSGRFLLEGIEPAFANALRRSLIGDLPKLAIEDVEFHLGPIRSEDGKEAESVAPLFDEMVAHRRTPSFSFRARRAPPAAARGARTARSSTP